jgi:hypothetical protein
VNAQVAEKEKEDRKLEMYNRIEAKSSTEYRGVKFKKSDILNFNRKLRWDSLHFFFFSSKNYNFFNLRFFSFFEVLILVEITYFIFYVRKTDMIHTCITAHSVGMIEGFKPFGCSERTSGLLSSPKSFKS